MKSLALAIATAVTLSGFATASESIVGKVSAGAPALTRTAQGSITAIKMVMGPTSAPQKPGGVVQEPQETPKLHKKARHKHKPA